MPYERLIKQGLIKAYSASEREIQSLLKIASRDLSAAESMVGIDPDWAYNISYNAMLQSSRALMLRKGYRPRGAGQHATVVRFVKETIGKEYQNHVAFFDQMRRKRNRLVYDMAKLVSEKESEEALSLAHDFVALLESLINREQI